MIKNSTTKMGKNTPPHSFLPCVCKRGGDLFIDLSYCFASLCVGLTLNTVLPTLSDHVFLLHAIPDLACNHTTFRTCFCILDLTLQHRKVCFVITSVCRFAEELHAIRSRYQFQHLTNLEILRGIVLTIGRNQRPIITICDTVAVISQHLRRHYLQSQDRTQPEDQTFPL